MSPTFRSLATGPGIGEGAHRRENPAASSRAAQPDREIDLAGAALALAVLEVPSVATEDCSEHGERLAEESAALAEPGQDPLAAPQSVLHDTYGYRGDTATYDDLENANLALVIERRKGLPVALGILYLHALRACGCAAEGLNFPEHFLIRLDHEGDRRIVDPFDGGSVRSAPNSSRITSRPSAIVIFSYASTTTSGSGICRREGLPRRLSAPAACCCSRRKRHSCGAMSASFICSSAILLPPSRPSRISRSGPAVEEAAAILKKLKAKLN